MRGISGNLERRCTVTKSNIDTMLMDLDRANLQLENTANKMLSLKNLQFIEARVQEDIEEGSGNTAASASSSHTKNAAVAGCANENTEQMTTMAAVRTAVNNGLRMLNHRYEKVTLHLDDESDADDDDNFKQSRCSRLIANVRFRCLMTRSFIALFSDREIRITSVRCPI